MRSIIYRTVQVTGNSVTFAFLHQSRPRILGQGTSVRPRDTDPTQYQLNPKTFLYPSLWAHVRNLSIFDQRTENALRVLELCPNLEDVGIWLLDGDPTPIKRVLRTLAYLKRVSWDPLSLQTPSTTPTNEEPTIPKIINSCIHFDEKLFRNVTHLKLSNDGNATQWSWPRWESLAHLPKLTHLAIYLPIPEDFARSILIRCSQLRVFALIYVEPCGTPTWLLNDTIDDSRLVIIYSGFADVKEQWASTALAHRGEFWETAESKS